MNILESEIEEVLFKNLDNIQVLKQRGFKHFEQMYYLHPNLGSYGIPDIVGFSIQNELFGRGRVLSVTVYELKKDIININTLLQATRYVKGILRLLDSTDVFFNEIKTNVVLIGRKIEENSDFVLMCDFISNLSLVTFDIDLESGIKFNYHQGYYHTNEQEVPLSKYWYDIKMKKWHKK